MVAIVKYTLFNSFVFFVLAKLQCGCSTSFELFNDASVLQGQWWWNKAIICKQMMEGIL